MCASASLPLSSLQSLMIEKARAAGPAQGSFQRSFHRLRTHRHRATEDLHVFFCFSTHDTSIFCVRPTDFPDYH